MFSKANNYPNTLGVIQVRTFLRRRNDENDLDAQSEDVFRMSRDVSFSLVEETSDSVRFHRIMTRVSDPRDVGHLIPLLQYPRESETQYVT